MTTTGFVPDDLKPTGLDRASNMCGTAIIVDGELFKLYSRFRISARLSLRASTDAGDP